MRTKGVILDERQADNNGRNEARQKNPKRTTTFGARADEKCPARACGAMKAGK